MKDNEESFLVSQLSAYLDGQLTPRQHERVERALALTPSLRAQLDALASTRDLLAALPHEPAPPDLAENVLGRLERTRLLRQGEHVVQTRSLGWIKYVAGAAVITVAVGLGAHLLSIMRHGGMDGMAASGPASTTRLARDLNAPSEGEYTERGVAAAPTSMAKGEDRSGGANALFDAHRFEPLRPDSSARTAREAVTPPDAPVEALRPGEYAAKSAVPAEPGATAAPALMGKSGAPLGSMQMDQAAPAVAQAQPQPQSLGRQYADPLPASQAAPEDAYRYVANGKVAPAVPPQPAAPVQEVAAATGGAPNQVPPVQQFAAAPPPVQMPAQAPAARNIGGPVVSPVQAPPVQERAGGPVPPPAQEPLMAKTAPAPPAQAQPSGAASVSQVAAAPIAPPIQAPVAAAPLPAPAPAPPAQPLPVQEVATAAPSAAPVQAPPAAPASAPLAQMTPVQEVAAAPAPSPLAQMMPVEEAAAAPATAPVQIPPAQAPPVQQLAAAPAVPTAPPQPVDQSTAAPVAPAVPAPAPEPVAAAPVAAAPPAPPAVMPPVQDVAAKPAPAPVEPLPQIAAKQQEPIVAGAPVAVDLPPPPGLAPAGSAAPAGIPPTQDLALKAEPPAPPAPGASTTAMAAKSEDQRILARDGDGDARMLAKGGIVADANTSAAAPGIRGQEPPRASIAGSEGGQMWVDGLAVRNKSAAPASASAPAVAASAELAAPSPPAAAKEQYLGEAKRELAPAAASTPAIAANTAVGPFPAAGMEQAPAPAVASAPPAAPTQQDKLAEVPAPVVAAIPEPAAPPSPAKTEELPAPTQQPYFAKGVAAPTPEIPSAAPPPERATAPITQPGSMAFVSNSFANVSNDIQPVDGAAADAKTADPHKADGSTPQIAPTQREDTQLAWRGGAGQAGDVSGVAPQTQQQDQLQARRVGDQTVVLNTTNYFGVNSEVYSVLIRNGVAIEGSADQPDAQEQRARARNNVAVTRQSAPDTNTIVFYSEEPRARQIVGQIQQLQKDLVGRPIVHESPAAQGEDVAAAPLVEEPAEDAMAQQARARLSQPAPAAQTPERSAGQVVLGSGSGSEQSNTTWGMSSGLPASQPAGQPTASPFGSRARPLPKNSPFLKDTWAAQSAPAQQAPTSMQQMIDQAAAAQKQSQAAQMQRPTSQMAQSPTAPTQGRPGFAAPALQAPRPLNVDEQMLQRRVIIQVQRVGAPAVPTTQLATAP